MWKSSPVLCSLYSICHQESIQQTENGVISIINILKSTIKAEEALQCTLQSNAASTNCLRTSKCQCIQCVPQGPIKIITNKVN